MMLGAVSGVGGCCSVLIHVSVVVVRGGAKVGYHFVSADSVFICCTIDWGWLHR